MDLRFTSSITNRFNFGVLTVSFIALFSFALSIGIYNYNHSLDELSAKTRYILEFAKTSLTEPIWNIDYRVLEDTVNAIMHDEDVITLEVKTEDDEVLVFRQRATISKEEIEELKKSGKIFEDQIAIKKKGQKIGVIKISTSTQKVHSYIKTTSWIICLFTLLLMILLRYAIHFISLKFLLPPISDLQESAIQLSKGNWNQSLNYSRNDELGSLARSFVSMRNAIRRKIADLKLLSDTGERYVSLAEQETVYSYVLETINKISGFQYGAFFYHEDDIWKLLKAFPNHDSKEYIFDRFLSLKEKFQYELEYQKIFELREGKDFYLFIPLIDNTELNGVIFFHDESQTADLFEELGEDKKELMLTVTRLTLIKIKNIQMLNLVKEQQLYLEKKVELRTEDLQRANIGLKKTLEELKQTQNRLVESEKMASLGGLVAGVAHEINTPLGVAVTASSYLKKITDDFEKIFQENQLKKSSLNDFISELQKVAQMVNSNLDRASEQIRSFKKVAVDQSTDEKRAFNVKAYIKDVLLSLESSLKKVKQTVRIECPNDLEINSFPGLFSQILTNLIMNTLIHAFNKDDEGQILIDIFAEENLMHIHFSDDGKGIGPENLKKIFDPFFTTNRQGGGSGLGLHIIYNIVNQQLKGSILCESEIGKGTTFKIIVPLQS